MRNMGIVHGSEEQAKPLIVGKDTVYEHTDIEKLENGLYQYNEIQYSLQEYIQIIADKNSQLESQLTDTELALVELYEMGV